MSKKLDEFKSMLDQFHEVTIPHINQDINLRFNLALHLFDNLPLILLVRNGKEAQIALETTYSSLEGLVKDCPKLFQVYQNQSNIFLESSKEIAEIMLKECLMNEFPSEIVQQEIQQKLEEINELKNVVNPKIRKMIDEFLITLLELLKQVKEKPSFDGIKYLKSQFEVLNQLLQKLQESCRSSYERYLGLFETFINQLHVSDKIIEILNDNFLKTFTTGTKN